ncbi:MAG: hypothetical protein ABGZ17_14105 [Planctomycetaceae bacterium]
MSFGLFSLPAVFMGVAALAGGLWLAQRLRVQHREVEVVSTIFWQAAREETRARVFVRRFRHWRAWGFLVVITSLLWLLLNQPQTLSWDGTRHIVLLDWSVDDPQIRQRDLDDALELAAGLPDADREIIAVGTRLETLLGPQEPLELARQRSKQESGPAPAGMDWAIESLAARTGLATPISIHIVGDASVDQRKLQILQSRHQSDTDTSGSNAGPLQRPHFEVFRVKRPPPAGQPRPSTGNLATLGVSDSASGQWNQVDLWVTFEDDHNAQSRQLKVLLNQQPLQRPVIKRQDGTFEIPGITAAQGLIEVIVAGRTVGAITLPNRERIRVQMQSNVPEPLRQLVRLDPACEIVGAPEDADVIIGSSVKANFRLTSPDQPAFLIQTENKKPQTVLASIVDELALRQIDATGIASVSGRVIDVQVVSGASRSLALWQSLFTPAFDFRESRACPIVVGRSLRWLANRPPLVEWAELGRRLPVASPKYDRASDGIALTNDGRQLRTTRLTALPASLATLPDSHESFRFWGFNPIHSLGILVAFLLIGEWVLFQKGYVP